MAKFKLSLKGNQALIKGLEKVAKETKEIVGFEIEASAKHIEQDAIGRVPVNTNFLRGSILAQADRSKLKAQVEVGMHYAPYVEFGTGGKVNVPNGLEDYARQFKGKGIRQVNLPPRPFLYPAFEAELPKLMQRINKGLEKTTK
jgi:HK97 gp10 family phage protein